MAHNLKKFNSEADYSAATLNYPAVSWVTGTNSVHFDAAAPATFGGLTVYYNIVDTANETMLFNGGGDSESGGGDSESGGGGAMPTTMVVDGVDETVVSSWRFTEAGEHIIQYTFADNTIPEGFLDGTTTPTNVTVGTDIIGISALAFNLNLTSASVEATTPPTIADENSFGGGAYGQNYTIYVPTSAVSTYQTQWSSLSSRIEAIQ